MMPSGSDMTLRFDFNPTDPSSAETYRALVEEISRSAVALTTGGRWGFSFGKGARVRDSQLISIIQSGLFDADFYVLKYRDVASTGADPLRHYVEFGDKEGRWPNAYFDPNFYRSQFDHSDNWPFATLYHYAAEGERAGLAASANFNGSNYLAANPELGAWVERPLAHFLWVGRHAGMNPSRRMRLPAGQYVVPPPRRGPPPISSPADLRRAVNIIGPLDRLAGLGISARGYFEGLTRSNFGPVGARIQTREFAAQQSDRAAPSFPPPVDDAAVNLVHMGGDTLPLMLNSGGGDLMSGRYNIAVWYWELPTLRPEWWALMDRFQAFWAPTAFIARAIGQLTARPVRIVPPYLPYLDDAIPQALSPHDRPHFLYCFDANSIVERKNPGLLLDAFRMAFPQGSSAQLTFKVTYPNRNLPEIDRLYSAARQDPRIVVIDRLLSSAEMRSLMLSATAYVSPHRAEGLGLTVVEAMALGVPVIATPFSGVEDFVTPVTAWPLSYRLVEIDTDQLPYPNGYVWAEPDLENLVDALRELCSDPASAQAKAKAARDHVRRQFVSNELIRSYRAELESIAGTIGLATA
jgi:glycosyltransferase involved in cell wall biosynthesis